MTEPSPPGWKCILPGPQPAWVCLGSVKLSVSTGETTGPWVLPLRWGQWGISGHGAQTPPETEGWGAPDREVPGGRCPGKAAAEAHARDLKAKRPSPLIHLLFPPSHEAPTSLLRLEDRPFIPACVCPPGSATVLHGFWGSARALVFMLHQSLLHFPKFFCERRLQCSQHQVSSGTLFQLTSWRHKAASGLPAEAAREEIVKVMGSSESPWMGDPTSHSLGRKWGGSGQRREALGKGQVGTESVLAALEKRP